MIGFEYSLGMTTLVQAVDQYLKNLADARSPRTVKSYRNALNAFFEALKRAKLDPETTSTAEFNEDHIKTFIKYLKRKSQATESQYLTAASDFYHFLAAEHLADPNLANLKSLIKKRGRKQGRRIPQFPRAEIEKLIEYAQELAGQSVESAGEKAKTEQGKLAERRRARLRNLRDRAFILFLADTGLRVDEACSRVIGDVDFLESRLFVLGKGDNEALVRISERALDALRQYLQERNAATPSPGEKTKSLPLFTRHDRGPGDEFTTISPQTGWNIVKARARECVGDAADQIHPHSFRHYFVTVVLLATNNLEIARRLARHKSISTTQRYTEIDPELDEQYFNIFNNGGKTSG